MQILNRRNSTPEYIQWVQEHFNKLLEKRINLLKENYARLDKNAKSLADDFINSEKIIKQFLREDRRVRPKIIAHTHSWRLSFGPGTYLQVPII